MLEAHPQISQAFLARLKSMSPEELQMLQRSINPMNAGVLTKLMPELKGTIAKNAAKTHQERQAMRQQSQGDQGGGLLSKFGMARGGMPLNRTGFVNKGIPSNYARGGMAMPHIAPPPKPESLDRAMPAELKVNSRKYNTPTFNRGGLVSNYFGGGSVGTDPGGMATASKADGGNIPQGNYAAGGHPMKHVPGQYPGPRPMPPQMPPMPTGLAAGGPPGLMANPEMAQKMANQNTALQAVPQESKADNVPANLSKGEFVMCAPTVMWFGMDKLSKMQEKAHEGMAQHMMEQQMHQQQGAPPGGPTGPGAPPPQQAQPRPMPPQGLAAPPPGMAKAVGGQMPPDATQQRIQASNTPKGGGMGQALSPIQ